MKALEGLHKDLFPCLNNNSNILDERLVHIEKDFTTLIESFNAAGTMSGGPSMDPGSTAPAFPFPPPAPMGAPAPMTPSNPYQPPSLQVGGKMGMGVRQANQMNVPMGGTAAVAAPRPPGQIPASGGTAPAGSCPTTSTSAAALIKHIFFLREGGREVSGPSQGVIPGMKQQCFRVPEEKIRNIRSISPWCIMHNGSCHRLYYMTEMSRRLLS